VERFGRFPFGDALHWDKQPENLLATPGNGADDRDIGRHCDVVVSGDRAFLFYFTHPGIHGNGDEHDRRRSSIQVTELHEGKRLAEVQPRFADAHSFAAAKIISNGNSNHHVTGISNHEFIERYAPAGAQVGLCGGTTRVDVAIRAAQRHLHAERR